MKILSRNFPTEKVKEEKSYKNIDQIFCEVKRRRKNQWSVFSSQVNQC